MKEIIEKFSYLMMRWEDEYEYEEWNEYVIAMKKFIAKRGGELLTMEVNKMTFTFEGKMHNLTAKPAQMVLDSIESFKPRTLV